MTGILEPSNEAYAMVKLAGITMCKSYNKQYGTNFISAQPANLYGPNDNFDLTSSHFLPALIRRLHEAKEETLLQLRYGVPELQEESTYMLMIWQMLQSS